MFDLHPEPVETYTTDHRDTDNREQLREPSESLATYKRVVEQLAADWQCPPLEAHHALMDGAYEMTKGLAWYWWPS